jgi:hypothetical protein
MQWQIINYWQTKSKMPSSIDDLKDSMSYNILPKDPETLTNYVYNLKGNTSFELCATFSLETQDTKGRGEFGYGGGMGYSSLVDVAYPISEVGENWKHPSGKFCFDRIIDPDKYKPFPKR